MFGSAFRTLWSSATDAAKTAAAAVATGAKVIGQAPVIASGIESVLSQADAWKRQAIETAAQKGRDFAAVTATEWKSWMDVKVAQAGAVARVAAAGVAGGLRGAATQAQRESQKVAQARAAGDAAVARRQAQARADEAGLRQAHADEWSQLRAANQARMQAARNLRAEISATGQRAAAGMLSAMKEAGEKGQAIAGKMDRKASELAHQAWHDIRQQFSRMVPHLCIPCLMGDLKLLAAGQFADAALSARHHLVGALAEGAAQHAAGGAYRAITFFNPALNAPDPSNPQNQQDGKRVAGDCLGQDGGSKTRGKVPSCCQGKAPSKKITFVNGIMTDAIRPPKDGKAKNGNICDAMQDIADSACAEVVGVYNATNGMLADLAECVENIQGASVSPAMGTLYGDVMRQLKTGGSEPIDIYAHSQGGLITQEALTRVRESLTVQYHGDMAAVDRAMSRIHVRSFGTAEKGWPAGPHYTHLRNTDDPVPHVIDGAQRDLVGPYDPPDYDQGKAQTFTAPKDGLFENHGMTETYMPRLRELRAKGDPSVSDLLERYDSQNQRCKCD